MLTSKITQTISHPDEPGVTFTLRKLSHHQLMMAEDARREKVFAVAKAMEGFKAPELTDEQKAEQLATARNPTNKYDRDTVLTHGVLAWSYPEPCDDDHKADLDEGTAAWLFSAIIVHSTRSADEGKGSASDSPPSSDPVEEAGPSN